MPKPTSTPQKRTLAEILEAREALENKLDTLIASAEEENRDFEPEEANQVITIQRQIADESKLIAAQQAVEQARLLAAERQRRIDRSANPDPDTLESKARNFSWNKYILGCVDGVHEGLEKEIVEDGRKEARSYKHMSSPRNPLPRNFLQIQTRDQDVGTTGKGQETIDRDMLSLIPALRPNLSIMNMGATMLTGLTSPVTIPRQTSLMSASWKGEKAAADETDASFDQIELDPLRLAAWSEFTRDLLIQSSIDVQAFVRRELADAIRRKLDKDLLIADGTSNDPVGLLNISGTGDASVGGSGATPDWADIVKFWTEIAVDNADVANMAFLTNPTVAGDLLTTPKVSGTDSRMLLESLNSPLGGYPISISTQVPSDLTDTVYEDQSALIFGNWADAIIAQWSGMDVIVDPYTKGKEAMIQVIMHTWWDFDIRHPESFSIAKDIGGTEII